MCDSVHTALRSPMFAKSLPVPLLSLQIKRQLRKGVSPVQSELRECCLEPSPTKPSPKLVLCTLGWPAQLGSSVALSQAGELRHCCEDAWGDRLAPAAPSLPTASIPSSAQVQEEENSPSC